MGGLLGFGVVAGWVFGREFTDGTVGSLFLAAVSRTATAAAKLLLVLAWSGAVAVALTATLLAAGSITGTAGSAAGAGIFALAAKFLLITAATALLALPAAWAATLGRGYLAAIGAVIGIVVVAQLAAMTGLGGWFPFSAPGLWASQGGIGTDATTAVQVLLSVPVGALAAGLTLRSWRRLTLS
ncbi:ABC transporter permease [Arthrobacter sp. TMN-37]